MSPNNLDGATHFPEKNQHGFLSRTSRNTINDNCVFVSGAQSRAEGVRELPLHRKLQHHCHADQP